MPVCMWASTTPGKARSPLPSWMAFAFSTGMFFSTNANFPPAMAMSPWTTSRTLGRTIRTFLTIRSWVISSTAAPWSLYYLISPIGDTDDSRADILPGSRPRPRLRRGDDARYRSVGAARPHACPRGAACRARRGRDREAGSRARAGRARRRARGVRRRPPAEPARHAAGERHAVSIDGRGFAAGQAFLLSCKTYWTRVVYPAVR